MNQDTIYCTYRRPVSFGFMKYLLPEDFDIDYVVTQETILSLFVECLTVISKIMKPSSIFYELTIQNGFSIDQNNTIKKPMWRIYSKKESNSHSTEASKFNLQFIEPFCVNNILNTIKYSLQQDIPENGHITLKDVDCLKSKIKLSDHYCDKEYLDLYLDLFRRWSNSEIEKISIIHDEDGHWIQSHRSPMSFSFVNDGSIVFFRIVVSWSLWLQKDTEDGQTFISVLKELLSLGWEGNEIDFDGKEFITQDDILYYLNLP